MEESTQNGSEPTGKMTCEPSEQPTESNKSVNPLREIVQPFIDLVHAPRALWGINLSYFLEGIVYWGILGYLAMFFIDYVGLADEWASVFVGVLTWGITFSMFFLGGLADRFGVRSALIVSIGLMLLGRVIMASGPSLGLAAGGLWSPIHWVTLGGIFFVVMGFGIFQPAAYAGVRQVTTPKTAAMGFAMLYALNNLGGWLPSFFSPVRKAIGISGAFWVFSAFSGLALLAVFFILSRKVMQSAIDSAKRERGECDESPAKENKPEEKSVPAEPFSVMRWLKKHPLADPKFAFFIFCLIPVQTLFAHNWLTLPLYVKRAYEGYWIGENFEAAVNFNPLLVFILVPIITALTQKVKVYKMMVLGTLVMAAPTFLLSLGANPWYLAAYIVIMTLGEAMWQPRFLQYAAEIAPEGRTGAYMGVAQFPWFLTKFITSLYAGWFLAEYCPSSGGGDPESMWFIYGLIAISSSIMLILARSWLGKDFKTQADPS